MHQQIDALPNVLSSFPKGFLHFQRSLSGQVQLTLFEIIKAKSNLQFW